MEPSSILLDIAFILLAARIFGEIASRIDVPPIIGELVAGIVLGPSLLGWVEPNDVLALLAEIGIILLLFEVGLETDIGRLVKAGYSAAVVALAGFILPFVLGFVLSLYVFNLSLMVSLFVGGTLTATSIGITARVLSDMKRVHSQEGQVVLGAAVIDDLLGVFLLAVLFEFSVSGSVSLANTGKIILYAGAFFLVAPIIAKLLVPLIKHYHFQSSVPGLLPMVLVSLVLIFASAAHALGAPELLGGFVAGIALSRRFFLPFGAALTVDPEFSEHTRQQMQPIIHLFTPLFFVMVGLSLDLKSVDWSSVFIWVFSISIAAIAILGKMVGPWFIRETPHRKIAIGMAMVPRGEVGLIFAELGRTANVFDAEVYAAMVIVIAYTTLFSPIWIRSFYKRYGQHLPADS